MRIEGKNLYLRHPGIEDVQILLKWENDPEIWEVGDHKSAFSEKEILDFILQGQNLVKNQQARFMICERRSDLPLGCIDLYEFDLKKAEAGVGILVYEKNHRKKGIGIESLRLLMDYCKGNLKLKSLFCRIQKGNFPSFKLFKKAGFIERAKAFEDKNENEWSHSEMYVQLSLTNES